MDIIVDGARSLVGESGKLASLFLILGICVTTLAVRNLLERSELLQGNSLTARILRFLCGAPRLAAHDAKHRDVLGQLRERLPVTAANGHDDEPSLVDLLSQIVDANATLHSRLESAEGTLENQVAEITAYKSEARTDALTGLANRRVFDELLKIRLAEWQRDGEPVSIVLFDIDHFKRFNDDYGHLAGDEVLTQVAGLLRETMEEGDLVARIGGEEFAVVVGGDLESAKQSAELVRQAIEEEDLIYEDQHLHVTVSVGVTESQGTENTSSLMKRVDMALYASKAAGRNIVHWHDGKRSIPLSPRRANIDPATGFATNGVAALTETKDFSTVCNELRQRLMVVATEEC